MWSFNGYTMYKSRNRTFIRNGPDENKCGYKNTNGLRLGQGFNIFGSKAFVRIKR